eukprot:4881573-Pyramimonas_sp.AAC.1
MAICEARASPLRSSRRSVPGPEARIVARACATSVAWEVDAGNAARCPTIAPAMHDCARCSPTGGSLAR